MFSYICRIASQSDSSEKLTTITLFTFDVKSHINCNLFRNMYHAVHCNNFIIYILWRIKLFFLTSMSSPTCIWKIIYKLHMHLPCTIISFVMHNNKFMLLNMYISCGSLLWNWPNSFEKSFYQMNFNRNFQAVEWFYFWYKIICNGLHQTSLYITCYEYVGIWTISL